ncbi:hypothetical protein BRC90_08310 [Halobacteriales archaeon QS_4_69_34]|nr:MAG: hypothetical protein BRC90_08310 [Halobacteriales archaeon QS_4_69_34]
MAELLCDERDQAVLGLTVFALPAAVHATDVFVELPGVLPRVAPLLVVAGPVLYWYFTSSATSSARTKTPETEHDTSAEGNERAPAPDGEELELIATNYEQLSEQSKYRDQLLINANYFSLAIVAVLMSAFLRTGSELRPLVAMVGTVTAYAFWLATESYKGTRDSLNDELRRIEAEQHGALSVVETYDLRERSPIGKRSLSSYLVGLQATATLLWWAVYFSSSVYSGYL